MHQLQHDDNRGGHSGESRGTRPALDSAAILGAFISSPEHAGLAPGERELTWVEELLDTMESAGWSWADLDLETFEAALLDGFGWSIESAPEDPARVARVLDAFIRFAGREYRAPHAAACCAYLGSPAGVDDIARWVRPFDALAPDSLFAELSPPYNWCDGSCDRCPLASRCPVHSFDVEKLLGAALRGDPEESRAAALAAAHTIAAREAIAAQAVAEIAASPEPPAAGRLRQSCRDYGFSVVALRDALAAGSPDPERRELGELRADAMLVAVKGGRVAGYLSQTAALEDEAALMDGVPNLLLVERIVDDIDQRFAACGDLPACASGYRAARDQLRELLRPLLRSVPSRYRDELRTRVLTGAAPSPFSFGP
jgi:hypothetical protein